MFSWEEVAGINEKRHDKEAMDGGKMSEKRTVQWGNKLAMGLLLSFPSSFELAS